MVRFSNRLRPTLALTTALCAAVACAPSVRAVSLRDDVPNSSATDTSNPYVNFGSGSAFDAIGYITFTNTGSTTASSGTGMLVTSSTLGVYKFLTAVSNVDNLGGGSGGTAPNGVADAAQYQLNFGARTSADGSTATGRVTVPASAVSIMPFWVSGNGALTASSAQYNMAVITFTLSNVTSGTLPTSPLGFSLTSPTAKTGTIVGYGAYGLGSAFTAGGPDGVRRAGNNTIDGNAVIAGSSANTGTTLQTDFDSPRDTTKSSLGSNIPLTLEASVAAGDQGGPLLVNSTGTYLIAGVTGGRYAGAGNNASEYGDRSVFASVLQSDNLQYLTAQGVTVPEPSTWACVLLGAGLLGLIQRQRQRRHA